MLYNEKELYVSTDMQECDGLVRALAQAGVSAKSISKSSRLGGLYGVVEIKDLTQRSLAVTVRRVLFGS